MNPFWKHVLWSWEFRRFTFSLSPRGALSQIVKRRAVPVKWRFHTYKKSRPIIPGGWNEGGLGLCANACGVRFLTTVQGLSPKQFRFDTSCLLDILPLRPHNMIKTRHLILQGFNADLPKASPVMTHLLGPSRKLALSLDFTLSFIPPLKLHPIGHLYRCPQIMPPKNSHHPPTSPYFVLHSDPSHPHVSAWRTQQPVSVFPFLPT